ncbi:dienelactone hydrolase family protein [Arthrobacter liuii]
MTLGNAETSVQAYVSEPAGTPKGGLLVVHEVWGLVGHTKDVADRFAAEGYLAVAPDLLSGAGGTPASGRLPSLGCAPPFRSTATPNSRTPNCAPSTALSWRSTGSRTPPSSRSCPG